MNDSRRTALRPHKDNVDELRRRGDRRHLFKVVNGHGERMVATLLLSSLEVNCQWVDYSNTLLTTIVVIIV